MDDDDEILRGADASLHENFFYMKFFSEGRIEFIQRWNRLQTI